MRLRAAVRKDQRRENRHFKRQVAEKELAEIQQRFREVLAMQRKTSAPLNLSPLDQVFRLALDPRYKRYFDSKPRLDDFQRVYPELTAPTAPDDLTEIVGAKDAGEEPNAEAFISPPVKVLRTFDPFDQGDPPTKKITTTVGGKEREVEAPDRDHPSYPRVVYPKGNKTFFYTQDLLQGRFLHVQIDLASRKEEIMRQFEAVVDAARELVKRGKTRHKELGKERRDIIRAAFRLRTNSPSKIAEKLYPVLYKKKTVQNLGDRRTAEERIRKTISKAKSLNILP
jgi:hypothetical protein